MYCNFIFFSFYLLKSSITSHSEGFKFDSWIVGIRIWINNWLPVKEILMDLNNELKIQSYLYLTFINKTRLSLVSPRTVSRPAIGLWEKPVRKETETVAYKVNGNGKNSRVESRFEPVTFAQCRRSIRLSHEFFISYVFKTFYLHRRHKSCIAITVPKK